MRDKIKALLDDLLAFSDPLDRLEYLIDQARENNRFPDEDKIEENRIEGCMAQLWMTASFDGRFCHFQSDSDSMVVKSIANLLCQIYDGATPQQVLEFPPDFLAEAGITSHLSANRRNALTRVWTRIKTLAEQHRPDDVA